MEEKCVCGVGTEWRGNTQGSWACIEKLDLLLINPVLRRTSQTHWRREFWCLRTSDHLYHCDQSISQKTPYPWRIKIQLEFCWEQTHSGHNIFFDTHLSISFFSGPLMAVILFSALIILSVCNDTHTSIVIQYLSHHVWLFKMEPLGSSILLQDYDIIIFFLMTEWCSTACIWKLVPRLCSFWVAITEPLRLGNLWGKGVYFGLYTFHSSVDRHLDYFSLMNITAMDTATIFALKWYGNHRQQLCRKQEGLHHT